MSKFYAKVAVIISLSLFFSINLASTEISKIVKQTHLKYENFLKEIKDITIVKETQMVGAQEKMAGKTKIMRKGKKYRIENTMNMSQSSGMSGNMKTIIIFDGKDTWMISPIMGKRKISEDEGEKYKKNEDWWKKISDDAKIVGTETVGTKKCYIIETKNKGNSEFTKIWLDKKSLTLVKFEGGGDKGESIIGINKDFRKVKGNLEMPYKTEMYINGKLFAVSKITSLSINKGLSDELFDANKIKTKQSMDMQKMMLKALEQGDN